MQKVKKCFTLFLCFVLIISTVFVYAATEQTGYVDATDVRVRTGPGVEHASLGALSRVTVTILDSATGSDGFVWYKIRYGSLTGYMRSDFIKLNPTTDDPDFETQLTAFPESYRDALRSLHAVYPNWVFQANDVGYTLEEAVNRQYNKQFSKLVRMPQAVSWRSMHPNSYNWATNTWRLTDNNCTGASWEIIAYYMDPRNFLNANDVYMFMQQSYSPSQTVETLRSMIAGTFLANGYDGNADAYIEDIMEAGRQSNISPYVLAGTIITEQGTAGTSSLISGTYSGYEGYYNFFNVAASGETTAQVVTSGLTHAKNKGWNSRRTSIIEGAKFYADGYINKGQDTYYYKDFNVLDKPENLWHQYAQYIADAYNNSAQVRESYITKYQDTLVFRIPVYKNMPTVAYACPASNNNVNNYYFTDLSVNGLSPAYAIGTQSYTLTVSQNTTLYYTLPENATYTGNTSFSLKAGSQVVTLPVKSQTGYTHNVTLTVTAFAACTLTVAPKSSGTTPSAPATSVPPSSAPPSSAPPATSAPPTSPPSIMLGDINGDKNITISDLANVQKHLLGIVNLTGDHFTAADINKDSKISISDLANVQKHLLGIINLNP